MEFPFLQKRFRVICFPPDWAFRIDLLIVKKLLLDTHKQEERMSWCPMSYTPPGSYRWHAVLFLLSFRHAATFACLAVIAPGFFVFVDQLYYSPRFDLPPHIINRSLYEVCTQIFVPLRIRFLPVPDTSTAVFPSWFNLCLLILF